MNTPLKAIHGKAVEQLASFRQGMAGIMTKQVSLLEKKGHGAELLLLESKRDNLVEHMDLIVNLLNTQCRYLETRQELPEQARIERYKTLLTGLLQEIGKRIGSENGELFNLYQCAGLKNSMGSFAYVDITLQDDLASARAAIDQLFTAAAVGEPAVVEAAVAEMV